MFTSANSAKFKRIKLHNFNGSGKLAAAVGWGANEGVGVGNYPSSILHFPSLFFKQKKGKNTSPHC